ncbi:DDE-type integrase/transposase/recombinase [Phormidium sp. FACHB-592]|uniref:DDE-type integrase/transposase/recombinase n=1 Tax=Stenomitos frigidus AS-A4 TaxID=2933935 RepID=A0ABV0KP72_9CYAN|nr:Mu transposase C-terminal domain-containing protein [Phormidium sp. FACHB-592]MBD2075470.1 DDE-type integrase/transposase/recombinase [Phormidium sp. FACHB-592]
MESLETASAAQPPAVPTGVTALVEEDQQPAHKILIELIEDLDKRREVMRKVEAVEDIIQASDELKQERIQLWADRLEKHPSTIDRWVRKAMGPDGLASLARATRSDAGQIKGCKRWKQSVEYWTEFILKTYNDGVKAKLGMTRSLVNNQLKGHAELDLGLKQGEYPSHMFVYNILDPLIEKKNRKVRNPGQGPGIIIKVTTGKKDGKWVEEDIEVIRSNQVWQIDHTRLDNLLTDESGGLAGSVWITAVIDSWSGCVMGYHLSFGSAGSHEVALALRHAILQKHCEPEYQLRHEWEVCGLPEYIVTDRAKEFRSAHLKHIASDLNIKLRLRLYTEQGGIVERLFLAIKTEFSALVLGFKGGSLKERPEHPEKYACVVYEDYARWLVQYLVDHHNQHLYPRVANQTRLMRWWAGLPDLKPRMPVSERELDLCLMKTLKRNVEERGCVNFEKLVYTASLSRDVEGHWRYNKSANFLKDYEGKKVIIRYNPTNIIYVLVYTLEENGQPSKFLGTIRARDLEEERLSLKEWEDRKRKMREEGKAIDQTSILAQQRDLFNTSIKQAKTLRQRRKTENNRLTKQSEHSDKVVQLFPPEAPPSEVEPESKDVRGITEPPTSEALYEPLPAEDLQSTQETPKIQIQPALYVVSDWNEFVEEGW